MRIREIQSEAANQLGTFEWVCGIFVPASPISSIETQRVPNLTFLLPTNSNKPEVPSKEPGRSLSVGK